MLSELSEITSDRVLLVGPDAEMLDLLREILIEAGIAVEIFDDAEPLEVRIADDDFHVVVCDEVRNSLDGIELFSRLMLSSGPQRSSFVLLGDDADGNRIASSLDEGLDDYMIKPFDVPELLARIRRAARAYRTRMRLLAHEPGDEIVGFSGDLDYLNLPDILMNLHQNVQTGKLYVEVEDGEYIYSYSRGELLKVRGPKGLKGRKAFYRAMRVSEGTFRFIVHDEIREKGKKTFDNLANLILQAVQEADEFPLVRENLPPDPVAVKLTGKVEDLRLDKQTAIQPLLEGLIQSTTVDILIHACPRTDLQAAQELEDLMKADVLVQAGGAEAAV